MNTRFIAPCEHARNSENPPVWWIEKITDDKRLSPKARHLGHVFALINDEGRVVASLIRLCNVTGILHPETIINARNELERAGYIRVVRSCANRIAYIELIGGRV